MFWVIIFAIIISCGCFYVWEWADHYLFAYLGDTEINGRIEHCYMYDTLTWPARIVAFLCGTAAIAVFILTWFGIYAMITA